MKEILNSFLRHAFTGLAGLGTYLAQHGGIDPTDVPAVNAAGVSLGDALQVIIAILLARLFLWLSGKVVKPGAPLLVVLCLCLGSLTVGGLSGCSGMPVTIGLAGPDGTVSYSDKGGLVVTGQLPRIDRHSGK